VRPRSAGESTDTLLILQPCLIRYERTAIERWFKRHKDHGLISPIVWNNGSPKQIDGELVPNQMRKDAITALWEEGTGGSGSAIGHVCPPNVSPTPTQPSSGSSEVEDRVVRWDQWGRQQHPPSVKLRQPEGHVAPPKNSKIIDNLPQELSKIYTAMDRMSDDLTKLGAPQPPIICVIGNESCGKSTLLEALIRMPLFPRATSFCTRMPIYVRLRRPTSAGEPTVRMSVQDRAGLTVGGEPEEIPVSAGYQFVQVRGRFSPRSRRMGQAISRFHPLPPHTGEDGRS
jgi:hypothetical protein